VGRSAAAAAVLVAVAGAAAPLDAAAVQAVDGRLRTMGTGVPIEAARVRMVDADAAVVASVFTDAAGHFFLRAPAAGRYTLVVERPGYASVVSDELDVPEGRTIRHVLTVRPVALVDMAGVRPGPDEVVRSWLAAAALGRCGPGGGGPVVSGIVRDASTGVALPGVAVTAEWWPSPGHLRLLQALTDGRGVYVFCAPPRGVDLALRAEAMDRTSPVVSARVDGEAVRADLELGLVDPAEPGFVLGRVLDFDTREPVPMAEVRFRGTALATLTDDLGFFRLDSVPRGVYVLEVDQMGRGHAEKAVRVFGRLGHQVEVVIAPEAIELDPIQVTVRSKRWYDDMVGFVGRLARGVGSFLTLRELEQRAGPRLVDALRGVPGLMVREAGRYAGVVVRQRACEPAVWVDGRPARPDPALGLNTWNAFDLEAVEVYRGPAEVPAQFARGSACGAVVLWTRRGG